MTVLVAQEEDDGHGQSGSEQKVGSGGFSEPLHSVAAALLLFLSQYLLADDGSPSPGCTCPL